ncbi:uncharacterized protein ACBR49_009229 [Aulostomus maculatus]
MMSTPLLLRAFVNERLTAAAEEIFEVFERTIVKYEEEASSSQREIDRLRGMLLDLVSNQKTDFSQPAAYEEETHPEQHRREPESNLRRSQRESEEPRPIKEEDQGLWAGPQEENHVRELQDGNDTYLPHSSAWGQIEHEDTKDSLLSQDTKSAHLMLSVTSALTSQTESVQEGQDNQRPVAGFTASDQTQTEHSSVFTDLSHSLTADFHCYLCGKSFSSKQHLINHAFRIHSKDTGVLCAVCGTTLESTESLHAHLKSHRGSKSCHFCGKQFCSTTSLTEHMTTHTGEKPHRCHVCGKECSRKGDLKIHLRIHTGEKPFRCSHCCKSFTHSGHLRKHMRSHTGERPYQCNVCGRGFLQSVHLKYHLKTHVLKS